MAELRLESIQNKIQHRCSNCRTQMLLPDWVGKTEYDTAVFQCPKCDHEAEIDISDYPKKRLKIYPLCRENSSGEKESKLNKSRGTQKPSP